MIDFLRMLFLPVAALLPTAVIVAGLPARGQERPNIVVIVADDLGHADRKYWPQNRGFDHFYGNLVGEVDPCTKERGGVIDWQRNGAFFREAGITRPSSATRPSARSNGTTRGSRCSSTSPRWPLMRPTRPRRRRSPPTRACFPTRRSGRMPR